MTMSSPGSTTLFEDLLWWPSSITLFESKVLFRLLRIGKLARALRMVTMSNAPGLRRFGANGNASCMPPGTSPDQI